MGEEACFKVSQVARRVFAKAPLLGSVSARGSSVLDADNAYSAWLSRRVKDLRKVLKSPKIGCSIVLKYAS